MKKDNRLILNATTFRNDALKDWTFKKFQETYRGQTEEQEKEFFQKFGGKLKPSK